ncbi:MAG: hypothetical protein J7L88_04140 [Thermoplasmata archaeon]|nr:hypothetical protein [Thermoplasmata archaeon]
MNDRIEISGRKYSKRVLRILTGGDNKSPTEDILLLARVFDNPTEFTYLLEDVLKLKKLKRVRYALLRMQVECQLHMNEDMEGYSRWLWIARTIEKALFGSLLLGGEE